jgi:uncharacterized protein YjiS (DUF1127 family)
VIAQQQAHAARGVAGDEPIAPLAGREIDRIGGDRRKDALRRIAARGAPRRNESAVAPGQRRRARRRGRRRVDRLDRAGDGLTRLAAEAGPQQSVHDRRGLAESFRRARQRRDLAALSEHSLRDIGLTPSDVAFEIRKPFWRI